eukprot:NODE_4188_length_1210_cov_52.801288_g3690_i0.p1 GENE.NODE_4188_length_1210_cov_52.801288_g3690_i0~~NODE_4188_length_1210_cov_52.801288_g3690_i0.p1  ORF type:complete len:296 (-),score=45.17 NODE_4188_length_1210_cov_52.801288_g3690_i0:72-959(-)
MDYNQNLTLLAQLLTSCSQMMYNMSLMISIKSEMNASPQGRPPPFRLWRPSFELSDTTNHQYTHQYTHTPYQYANINNQYTEYEDVNSQMKTDEYKPKRNKFAQTQTTLLRHQCTQTEEHMNLTTAKMKPKPKSRPERKPTATNMLPKSVNEEPKFPTEDEPKLQTEEDELKIHDEPKIHTEDDEPMKHDEPKIHKVEDEPRIQTEPKIHDESKIHTETQMLPKFAHANTKRHKNKTKNMNAEPTNFTNKNCTYKIRDGTKTPPPPLWSKQEHLFLLLNQDRSWRLHQRLQLTSI